MSVQELVGPTRPQLANGRLVWVLGLGAFGLAFSITTLTFLPVELRHFTSSGTLIALVLGAEGVFALLLSPVIGPWSDTFHTPLGRRRPFMLVALGPMAFCLLLMAFMPNLWTTALVVFAFFFAYYVYEPPYRGLYPDLLPPEVFGRAQGVQHVLRGHVLGGAHLRRPLHHEGPARVAEDRLARARDGGGRLRGRGGVVGPRRRPRRARPRDLRLLVRLRRRAARRRVGPRVARLVLRAHLPGRDRRWRRHDPGVGPALQAHAAEAPRRDLGPRDDDEGGRPDRRPAPRGRRDRPRVALPQFDRRLPGALAGVRAADPRRDPARRAAHAARGRYRHCYRQGGTRKLK